MNAKERFIAALTRQPTDRLPVTTHHIMPSFLKHYMSNASSQVFFDTFGIDPINWVMAYACSPDKGEYHDPAHTELGFLEARRVCSDNWQVQIEPLGGYEYETHRFSIITPDKTLSMVLQTNEHTTWLKEHLVKEKKDIDCIAKYMTYPLCDVPAINRAAVDFGNRGLIRGHIMAFEGFGQPGCWQDASCLFGTENLIMATFDDPEWVHTFLSVLCKRKKIYINSLKGANYDLLELGGGDASTTVISPDIFRDFIIPYDSQLIEAAHQAGQRIVYHTCGGMMPILEDIASMKPDAMETFTPSAMGGDVVLHEAKKRVGDQVCMIGGFDQFHFFNNCSEEETRREVRRCFAEAGEGGGFILSPSDHFFDADLNLIRAFADEAKKCSYGNI
jgi:uroporphyrinogen-III decarboxylase